MKSPRLLARTLRSPTGRPVQSDQSFGDQKVSRIEEPITKSTGHGEKQSRLRKKRLSKCPRSVPGKPPCISHVLIPGVKARYGADHAVKARSQARVSHEVVAWASHAPVPNEL